METRRRGHRFLFVVARSDRTFRGNLRVAGQSSVGCRLGIFFRGKEQDRAGARDSGFSPNAGVLFRHTIIASEAPTYAKIIGYGAGYWLWLTSAGLVILSGTTGLVKQR